MFYDITWGEFEDIWFPRYIFRRNAVFGTVLYYELPRHRTGDLLVPKPRAVKFVRVQSQARYLIRNDVWIKTPDSVVIDNQLISFTEE